jgi:hypothetical protein
MLIRISEKMSDPPSGSSGKLSFIMMNHKQVPAFTTPNAQLVGENVNAVKKNKLYTTRRL